MSSRFNAFEEALDFSFWMELCEKHGKMMPADIIALEDSDVLVIHTEH